jgi:hypothetical protein
MSMLRTPDDYTRLTCDDVATELRDVAGAVQSMFGGLGGHALNWRPDATRWSVAQCLEHLLTANRLMVQAAQDALSGAAPRTIWQRLPVLPGVWGAMLIRSQAPSATRKFTAPAVATPTGSAISTDILTRFVQQQRDAAETVAALDAHRASMVIMTSPFIRVVTYSVLDGWRIVVAHDHRHIEQARRVTKSPGFPGAP